VGVWRDATTPHAGACKEEQERSRCRFSGITNPAYPLRVQSQAPARTCQRVRSGLTYLVNAI